MEILYRYYDKDIFSKDGVLKNILEGNIRFSHPTEFNDPLDSLFHFSTPLDDVALEIFTLAHERYLKSSYLDLDDRRKVIVMACMNLRNSNREVPFFSDMYYYFRQEFPDNFRDIMKMIGKNIELHSYVCTFDAFYEYLGIFCMSKKPDSLPMWAYYASANTGFCVEYELDEKLVNESCLTLGKVDYNKTYFCENTTGTTSKDEMRSFICGKSKSWEHEEEYRLFSYHHSESIILVPGRVKSVCIGYKTTNEHRHEIVRLAELLNVAVKEATLNFEKKHIEWV